MDELRKQIIQIEKQLDEHGDTHIIIQKEVLQLRDEVNSVYEKITQQLSGLGSDIKAMNIKLNEYMAKVEALELDKKKKDGWIEWFQRAVIQIVILAVALAIGIKIK